MQSKSKKQAANSGSRAVSPWAAAYEDTLAELAHLLSMASELRALYGMQQRH